MKILYLVNCSDFFCSHFLPLAIAAKNKGYDVVVAAGNSNKQKRIESLGLSFVEYRLSRSGKSILAEVKGFFAIFKLIGEIKPDLLHMLTIKPILYGCIVDEIRYKNDVSRLVASITGLGSSSLSTRPADKCLGISYSVRTSFRLFHIKQMLYLKTLTI